jgi:signal transduction histidine kinase
MMRLFQPNIIVEFLAVVFCLQIGLLFGVLSFRGRARQEHLAFSLFNLFLAYMMVCRLAIQAAPSNRYLALHLFQWHCVAGCGAVSTFVHFTLLATRHHLYARLPPQALYPVAFLTALCFFSPWVLHLAPSGVDPGRYDDLEIGHLFPALATALILCGILPCFLLFSTMRKLKADLSASCAGSSTQRYDVSDVGETLDLVLLRRHITLIFRSTLVLMVFNLVDLAWFINPTSDSPLSFSAIGMILLSVTIASVLAKDIIRSEKRKLNLEAIAQARLHALSDMQHQFKNQIAAVRLPLQTAIRGLERGRDTAFLKEKLTGAITEADDCVLTLDTMLNVARVEADTGLDLGLKVSLDLAALLETLCAKRKALEDGALPDRYCVQSSLPCPTVFLRAMALRQVLVNLIDNAFKYSPSDTPILVQVEVDPSGETLHISFTDQGKGVDPEDLVRIFREPFYRGKADTRAIPGTGLGLNMAYRYIEAMGGRLTVESVGAEAGSTFVVSLPYEPDLSIAPMRAGQ